MTVDRDRLALNWALNVEVGRLYEAFRRSGRGQSVAIFLHQSIATCADEGTLERVLADVRDELARLSELEVVEA